MCDPTHPARLRDIFARGHFFEEQSRQHFSDAGFKFADKDRLEFEALDGWLRGHADGILLSGPDVRGLGYPCLWEHKAINAKGWRSLERDGLAKHYPQYAAQVGSTSSTSASTRTRRSSPRSTPTTASGFTFSCHSTRS